MFGIGCELLSLESWRGPLAGSAGLKVGVLSAAVMRASV
jgi:hypothetical protein